MSLLANLATDDQIKTETDSVGGGGPRESGLYPLTIDMAYLDKKATGALFVNMVFKDDNGGEYRENFCVQSGDAKGNKNYYENAQGERHYLPGFNHVNSMALLSLGKELAELGTVKKTIKKYSRDAGAEVMTDVDAIEDLLGQRVIAAIQKQIVDKTVKNEATGRYEPNGETREVNEIDKIFRERDKLTQAEIRAGATEPSFYDTWDKKWTGQTRNKASAANDANGASQGAPKVAAGKPKSSLFG